MDKLGLIKDYIEESRKSDSEFKIITHAGIIAGTPFIAENDDREAVLILKNATFYQGSFAHNANAVTVFIDSIQAIIH